MEASPARTPARAADRFASLYHLGERIGSGGFADVHQALDRTTGEDCAVKIIRTPSGEKGKESVLLARREVDIHSSLRHPSILSLRSAFMDEKAFYIVTERCKGGDLLDAIRGPRFAEGEIREIMWTLVKGVEHMHSRGIVHRDLKLENILIASQRERTKVKIADLGIAASLDGSKNGRLRSMTGSLLYVAPEILRTQTRDTYYDERVDIWSLGVCLYILLCGHPPFGETTKESQLRRMTSGELKCPADWFLGVSGGAVDLVRRMLVVDPSQRLSTGEIMAHAWMAESVPRPTPSRARRITTSSFEVCAIPPFRRTPGEPAKVEPATAEWSSPPRPGLPYQRAGAEGVAHPLWNGGMSPDVMTPSRPARPRCMQHLLVGSHHCASGGRGQGSQWEHPAAAPPSPMHSASSLPHDARPVSAGGASDAGSCVSGRLGFALPCSQGPTPRVSEEYLEAFSPRGPLRGGGSDGAPEVHEEGAGDVQGFMRACRIGLQGGGKPAHAEASASRSGRAQQPKGDHVAVEGEWFRRDLEASAAQKAATAAGEETAGSGDTLVFDSAPIASGDRPVHGLASLCPAKAEAAEAFLGAAGLAGASLPPRRRVRRSTIDGIAMEAAGGMQAAAAPRPTLSLSHSRSVRVREAGAAPPPSTP